VKPQVMARGIIKYGCQCKGAANYLNLAMSSSEKQGDSIMAKAIKAKR